MANWIAGAVQHPGALHQQMGIPQGQPIPAGRLQKAASAPGLLGERARLAETLKELPHRGYGGPLTPNQPTVVGERGRPEIVTARGGGMVRPIGRPAGPAPNRAALLAKLGGPHGV